MLVLGEQFDSLSSEYIIRRKMSYRSARWPWTSLTLVLIACWIQLSVGLPSQLTCEDGQIACDDGSKCYAEADRCDFFPDCDDNSDEQNCESTTTCDDDEFLCEEDDVCYPSSYWCDGQMDCSDGSDEESCSGPTGGSGCESSSEFTCLSDRVCINKVLHCDGVAHCVDGSDERGCNNTDVVKPTVPRPSAGSTEHVQSTMATCDQETEMDCLQDGTVCIPISQLCDGESQCPHGEDEDTDTCDYYNGDEAQVWVANGHSIVRVRGNSNRPETQHVGGHILRLAYDHATNRIFWIDSDSNSINVMQADGSGKRVLINTAIDTPTALAYDWVHGVLYWADSGLHNRRAKIEAVVVSSGHRHMLFSSPDVDSPRVLAVDPRPGQGYLYWGQGGEKPCIYKAGLDGFNRTCISNRDYVRHPNGMTLDIVRNRLLWLDSHMYAILSWDLIEEKQITVDEFNPNDKGLSGIAVFEDWIYWGESGDHSVYKIHKSQKARDDENAVNLVVNGVTQPTDVIVYHGLQQPQGENPCALHNGGCSHICLRSPTAALRRCVCPNVEVMYNLSPDNRTCVIAPSPRATSTSSSPGGPAENGVVVGIVVGAFVLFIATVIGSVAN